MKNRIAAILFSVLLPWGALHAEYLQPTKYGDFDSYVLALSWQPGFCQNLHQRGRKMPDECQRQQESRDKTQFLSVHGLWPGLPASIAARGVDNKRWMRFGCATRPLPNMPEARASQKCAAPAPQLDAQLAAKLNEAMPGAGGRSCLERYEFAKHGACFGFSPNAYFATMIRLNQTLRQSTLGHFLNAHYGQTVTRKAFNQALRQQFGDTSVKAVKLTCSGNPGWLTEIQITLNAETINQPLDAKSFQSQPHPGNCGAKFRLDAVGYMQ